MCVFFPCRSLNVFTEYLNSVSRAFAHHRHMCMCMNNFFSFGLDCSYGIRAPRALPAGRRLAVRSTYCTISYFGIAPLSQNSHKFTLCITSRKIQLESRAPQPVPGYGKGRDFVLSLGTARAGTLGVDLNHWGELPGRGSRTPVMKLADKSFCIKHFISV